MRQPRTEKSQSLKICSEGLRVPDLWAREIANGLAVAYLRKRITSTARHPRAARRGLNFLARRGAGLVSRSALSGSLMKFSGCSRLAQQLRKPHEGKRLIQA